MFPCTAGVDLFPCCVERVIVIRFPSREKLDACFASEEYRHIMHERADNVDARALIVEGEH